MIEPIIDIEQCGFMTTLQDSGRHGFLQFGVSKGGAMDSHAAQLANLLLGNAAGEAVLEMTQSPHRFRFLKEGMVAFTGAGIQPQIADLSIPLNKPVYIHAGTVVDCKQSLPGFRLYMAVTGGFRSGNFLNSFSTDLLVKAGGYEGRTLQKKDVLNTNAPKSPLQKKMMTVLKAGATVELNYKLPDYRTNIIRVMEGIEWEMMNETAQTAFATTAFTISGQSSRMGYRLKGGALSTVASCDIISSPVTQGTIQLTASGELIVLMADAQTVGGYPRIAQVCAVDVPILAQKKPGDQISFHLIRQHEAEELYLKQREELRTIEQTLKQLYAG
jgi:antagonist of KipI